MRKLRRQTLIYAAGFGLAGMLVGLIPSYFLFPNRYTSNSVIRVQPAGAGERLVSALRSEIAQRHLKDAGVEMIRANPKVAILRISVTDPGQRTAQRTNQELISAAFLTAIATSTTVANNAEVVDNASYPATPSGPNRYIIAFLGLGAGVLSGGATARIRARTNS
jgi:hypothetical protein